MRATIEKDAASNVEEGLIEVYKKLRPSEPPTVDSAQTHINNLFFDPGRYDMSRVGRYKYNKSSVLQTVLKVRFLQSRLPTHAQARLWLFVMKNHKGKGF